MTREEEHDFLKKVFLTRMRKAAGQQHPLPHDYIVKRKRYRVVGYYYRYTEYNEILHEIINLINNKPIVASGLLTCGSGPNYDLAVSTFDDPSIRRV